MICSLPAETVFEAKTRTRRQTQLLFILLVLIYTVFANLLVFATIAFLGFNTKTLERDIVLFQTNSWQILLWSTVGAFFVAFVHFLVASGKPLAEILDQLWAKPADPKDEYHSKFIHIVEEVEVALGGRKVQPVVIPTAGANAFSIEDGLGNAAIGATEGLLNKLNRAELSAVIAHEAAHLAHGDSRLTTIACSLFSVFDFIRAALGGSEETGRRRLRLGGRTALLQVCLWFIATVGAVLTRLIYMAVSRSREYFADADGVQMCKDPASLAEALYKISSGYRGHVDVPEGFSAIFILNPQFSDLDERESFFSNLFSTHPPVHARLQKLMVWAKSDVRQLADRVQKELQEMSASSHPFAPEVKPPQFLVHHEDGWKGPYTPIQMLSLGLVTPQTMVREMKDERILRASESEFFLPLFQNQLAQSVSQYKCPRCKVSLIEKTYEGAPVSNCSFCSGYLIRSDVLDRIITRREKKFSSYDIEVAVSTWKVAQKETIKEADTFPNIKCPLCADSMLKSFHTMHTRVVIDRCLNPACRAIWCDGWELETIQMLIENLSSEKFG